MLQESGLRTVHESHLHNSSDFPYSLSVPADVPASDRYDQTETSKNHPDEYPSLRYRSVPHYERFLW